MTRLRGPIRWSMCSGSIAPMAIAADDLVEVRARVDGLAVDALEDHRQGRVRQDRPVRQDAEQRDAVARQARARGSARARAWRRGRPC